MYDGSTAPDAEAFPFDLEGIDLSDPFTPEQGVRAPDDGSRYCACGRPIAHARLRRTTICACGLDTTDPANSETKEEE